MSLVALTIPLTGLAQAAHAGCGLNIQPENDSNPTGTTHTLTATLVENTGNSETAAVCNDVRTNPVTVDFEIDCVSGGGATYTGETLGNAEDPDATDCGTNDGPNANDDMRDSTDMECVIPANSGGSSAAGSNSCTVSYTRDTTGQDEIVGWVDEDDNDATDNSDAGELFGDSDSDSTDAVAKFWFAPSDQEIDCGPEGDVNPVATQHTVTCTVRANAGANPTLEGADVDYQVSGANPTGPQHGCTTGQNGQCSFAYTGNNAGNDVIQAFVNSDGNHTNNDCGAEATADATNDDFCDQVEKTWQARVATFLDIEAETDTNPNATTHTLTAFFTDQFGDPATLSEAQLVDFEIIAGPNANLTPNFRDFECPSNNPVSTSCTASYTDGAAFDANNATDTICAWLSNDGDDDQYNPAGTPEDGGDCDTETTNETEQGVDPNGNNIAGNEGNDLTDTVLKTWTPAVAHVNAEPEQDSEELGDQQIIGVAARDAAGNASTATPIYADILPGSVNAGPGGAPEITCSVDPSPSIPRGTYPAGHQETHECTYGGTNQGLDVIRVFADRNGNGLYDNGEPFDDVETTWTFFSGGGGGGGGGSTATPSATPSTSTSSSPSTPPSTPPPATTPPAEAVRHSRSVDITGFKHVDIPGKKSTGLIVRGIVTSDDGFEECSQAVGVKVQIRLDGEWITRKSDTTNDAGVFKVLIRDVTATYRAVASRTDLELDDDTHLCQRAAAKGNHQH